jgi:hypothetical protein
MLGYTPYSDMFDERFEGLTTSASGFIRQHRSAHYLNWRFRSNPRRNYVVFTATDNGVLVGYLIVRITNIFGMRLGLIVDFVAKTDSQANRNLVLGALAYFWDNDTTIAAAACFPNCLEYRLMRQSGFFVAPDKFRKHPFAVCVKEIATTGFALDLVNMDNWFFMLGDYETF